ncbi:oligosaccharide flippase family protein [Bowmanella dokdonensis]|uniref:Oligosaccharide flippase family protein n=1 Tax=Bowmanella dokdonensis TaxID=751969 RepID=A0A939ITJ4_9ALTE|nr:oligosaccharide flippase family protein [Bowmanella dokdonensis]MBN7827521.1 oligosaccharide flippase family protein [Bowmanella dokdonensis]
MSLISGAHWTAVSTAGRAIIQIIQLSVLVRLLDKEEFATLAILQTLLLIIVVLIEFGTGSIIVAKRISSVKLTAQMLTLNFILGSIYAVLLLLFGQTFLQLFDLGTSFVAMALFSVLHLVSSLTFVPAALLQLRLKFKAIAVAELLCALINLSVIAVTLSFGAGLAGVMLGFLLGMIIKLWILASYLDRPLSLQFPSLEKMLHLLRFGSYRSGSMLLNQIGSNADILIVGRFLGVQDLAVYAAVRNLLAKTVQLFSTVLGKLVLPVLSQVRNNSVAFQSRFLKSLALLSAIIFPVYGALAVTSNQITLLVFGDNYPDAYWVMSLLVGVSGLRVLMGLTGQALLSRSLVRHMFVWNLGVLSLSCVVILLAAKYDLQTVCVTLLVMQIMLWITQTVWLLGRLCELNLIRYFTTVLVLGVPSVSLVAVNWYVRPFTSLVSIDWTGMTMDISCWAAILALQYFLCRYLFKSGDLNESYPS